jgi:hypothetical protein
MEAGEMLISSQTDGAFLIRESESMKGVYVLSLRSACYKYMYRDRQPATK